MCYQTIYFLLQYEESFEAELVQRFSKVKNYVQLKKKVTKCLNYFQIFKLDSTSTFLDCTIWLMCDQIRPNLINWSNGINRKNCFNFQVGNCMRELIAAYEGNFSNQWYCIWSPFQFFLPVPVHICMQNHDSITDNLLLYSTSYYTDVCYAIFCLSVFFLW